MTEINFNDYRDAVQNYDPDEPADLAALLKLSQIALDHATDGDLAAVEVENARQATLQAGTDLSKARAHIPDEELRPDDQ